jgi:hypothetical protein
LARRSTSIGGKTNHVANHVARSRRDKMKLI